jgi:peroxiredoxin
MNKLQNGDQLPPISLKVGESGIIHLPADIATDYAIILFYRGHWCPFCRRLLDAYEQRLEKFNALGTSIYAASVDSLEKAEEVAATVSFPIAWGVDRALGNLLGSFWEERRDFIQPTEFIVNNKGLIYSSTYSSSPVGRTDPEEALAALRFYIERDKG